MPAKHALIKFIFEIGIAAKTYTYAFSDNWVASFLRDYCYINRGCDGWYKLYHLQLGGGNKKDF